MGERRGVYGVLLGKPEERKPLGRRLLVPNTFLHNVT